MNTPNSSNTMESIPEFQKKIPVTLLESQTGDIEIIGVQKVKSCTACFKCSNTVNNSQHQTNHWMLKLPFKAKKQNFAPKH